MSNNIVKRVIDDPIIAADRIECMQEEMCKTSSSSPLSKIISSIKSILSFKFSYYSFHHFHHYYRRNGWRRSMMRYFA